MADGPKPRIAVVDDNPATLYSTAHVLRGAQFEVSEGVNGAQAIELAFQGIDILLLDVHLPDIHGFEVVRRLREDPRTSHLPVIHVSATFVGDLDKVQGLEAGGDGYLTHPIEPPVLVATVKAFLRARRAEDETRRSEAKFKAIFENAVCGILLLDFDLKPIEVNPALCELLQRGREQIRGQPLTSFMPPGISVAPEEIERELEQRGTWRGAFPLLRTNGDAVHLEWFISTHSFPGVRLAVATDVTERMRLEAERNRLLASERIARAEAERANRHKDDFLGTLSHELRTPLNSILLWTQLARQQIEHREQVIQGLEAIERNTRVQAQLISDLLDVSRIISGKLQLDREPLDIGATIKAALEGLLPAMEEKQIRLRTQLNPNIGIIAGDARRLQQVIWNLVTNAIKFTPAGGQIEVRAERHNSHIEINVRDSGQGIERDVLPHLFERFWQGQDGSSRNPAGLGLGLAIVKHLVELHGGSVMASSAGVDKGAEFTVSLPIRSFEDWLRAPAQTQSTGTNEIMRLDGVRILLVDDDADSCRVMSRILREAGAVVATAGRVDIALAELELFRPQVLVSDIWMPERDGYELIREIRARGYSYQILPAIALTALARPEDRRSALLAGYQAHAAKPIDTTDLTAAIAALLGRTA